MTAFFRSADPSRSSRSRSFSAERRPAQPNAPAWKMASGGTWEATPGTPAPPRCSTRSTPRTSTIWRSPGSGGETTTDPASSTRSAQHPSTRTERSIRSSASAGRWPRSTPPRARRCGPSESPRRSGTCAHRGPTSAKASPMRRSTGAASSSSPALRSFCGPSTPRRADRWRTGVARWRWRASHRRVSST